MHFLKLIQIHVNKKIDYNGRLYLFQLVVSPQNPGDHQTFSINGDVGFHVTFLTLSILFWVTLCKAKWDCHSFLNHKERD